MGQVALGFRSLLIKAAVFVALASLLAWALGGTLWPRPQIAHMEPVDFAGKQWHWQLAVGGARGEPSWVRWSMMVSDGNGAAVRVDDRHWRDVAGPVATEDALYYAGRLIDDNANVDSRWTLERVTGEGVNHSYTLPDRLAVEQQLARIRTGLDVQSEAVQP